MDNQQMEEKEMARQQEMDMFKAKYMKEMELMQQAHRSEVEALAAQNRETIAEAKRYGQEAAELREENHQMQQWLSDSDKRYEALEAKNSMKDEIILNLSRNLKH